MKFSDEKTPEYYEELEEAFVSLFNPAIFLLDLEVVKEGGPVACADSIILAMEETSRKLKEETAHRDLLVEILAEVKATNDGESDQPVSAIIEGGLKEIAALSDHHKAIREKLKEERTKLEEQTP